jgi:hypothetical protein
MKTNFKKIIYDELIREKLNKYLYQFKRKLILDDKLITNCELVTFNNEKYILILDKNSDIQTNIHHIKTNFNIIKVQDYKDDFGLVYYKTLIN